MHALRASITEYHLETKGDATTIIHDHFEELKSAIDNSTSIKNILSFNEKATIEQYFTEDNLARRFNLILFATEKKKNWYDILSENTQNNERHQNFLEKIKDEYKCEKKPRYYHALILRTFPVVSAAIFLRQNGGEVWFSFGSYTEGTISICYRSTNSELVGHFVNYWDALNAASKPWEQIWRTDIEGAWLCAAYCKHDEVIDREKRKKGDLVDVAGIYFYMDGTSIRVRGVVFKISNGSIDRQNARLFISSSSDFRVIDDRQADFEYFFSRERYGKTVKGGASYKFRYQTSDSAFPQTFTGDAFTDEGHTREIKGERLKDGSKWAAKVKGQDKDDIAGVFDELKSDDMFVMSSNQSTRAFKSDLTTDNKYFFDIVD